MNKIRNRMKKVANGDVNGKLTELTNHVVNELTEFYISYYENEKDSPLDAELKEQVRNYVLETNQYGPNTSIDEINNTISRTVDEVIKG